MTGELKPNLLMAADSRLECWPSCPSKYLLSRFFFYFNLFLTSQTKKPIRIASKTTQEIIMLFDYFVVLIGLSQVQVWVDFKSTNVNAWNLAWVLDSSMVLKCPLWRSKFLAMINHREYHFTLSHFGLNDFCRRSPRSVREWQATAQNQTNCTTQI